MSLTDSSVAVHAVISVLTIVLLLSALLCLLGMATASFWNASAQHLTQPAAPDHD